jgi:hypothetical protein
MLVKNHGLDNAKERRDAGGLMYIAIAILYFYFNATIHWIMAMFNCYSYSQTSANAGWIINSAILIGIVSWQIIKYRDSKDSKEEKPNIIAEFVRAKYNHYCPKIDWE